MSTIITPIASVDAIQRVPVGCWIGPWDNGGNGFPNYPVWCDAQGTPVDTLDQASHVLWDGAFGPVTAKLIAAIGQDPTLVPADVTDLERATLLDAYKLTDTPAEGPIAAEEPTP